MTKTPERLHPPRKKSKTQFFTSPHMMEKGVISPVIFYEGENGYESVVSVPVRRLSVLLRLCVEWLRPGRCRERLLEQLRLWQRQRQERLRLPVRLRLRQSRKRLFVQQLLLERLYSARIAVELQLLLLPFGRLYRVRQPQRRVYGLGILCPPVRALLLQQLKLHNGERGRRRAAPLFVCRARGESLPKRKMFCAV